MKTNIVSLCLLIASLILASCDNQVDTSKNTGSALSMDELVVSDDFTWSTNRDVSLTVGVVPVIDDGYKSKVSVYKGNPLDGGTLVVTGSVSVEAPFQTDVYVATSETEIYLQCDYSSGRKDIVLADISKGNVEYTFIESVDNVALKSVSSGPTCDDDCDEEVSSSARSITVEKGKTVCIKGTFNGDITFKGDGGILRICGNATIRNFNSNGNPDILVEVTATGILNSTNINLNKKGSKVINWGIINYPANFSPTGNFDNYGIANISGYNVNSQAVFYNAGQMNISGHFNNNNVVVNDGKIVVAGHCNNNGQGDLTNNCSLIISGNFNQNNDLFNSGYIYAGGGTSMNGKVNEMIDGAMIKTNGLMLNQNLNGTQLYSSIEVIGTTHVNGSGSITGQIDICDADGIEVNNGRIASSVTYCENYIPVSGCNPVGIGSPALSPDPDGDGVLSEDDIAPDDPYRAYESYFPSENHYGSVLFEDLWPSSGDYDFNDLVLGMNVKEISNSNNEIVELFITFKVKAIGASNMNGFGIQFDDLTPADIESVSGAILKDGGSISNADNGTELSQSKAVIVVVESVEDVIQRAGGSMFNTLENGYVGSSTDVVLHVTFGETTPVSRSLVGISSYNVFLIKGQDRGVEIHLADKAPTDLMTSAFGTEDDASNPAAGTYYKTSKNLPWGLFIVSESLLSRYPLEKVSIVNAFPYFGTWAQSGGTTNANWYNYYDTKNVWSH